jgi:RNA polymerase sigma-32 factor
MANLTLPAVPVDGGLSRYFNEVWAYPILTANEEVMLAERLREHNDSEAAHKLITSHLRLVAKMAMGYRGYGLPVADLMSEGTIGLMRAVKKFDPDRGFRLSTYAMWWIKASITEYVLKSWSMVKLGTVAAQKKLFFSLRRVKNNLVVHYQSTWLLRTKRRASSMASWKRLCLRCLIVSGISLNNAG